MDDSLYCSDLHLCYSQNNGQSSMPPKEQKEVNELVEYVKSYWSDFDITGEDLIHPTLAFVTCFYRKVFTELNEKFSYLLDQDLATPEPPIKEFEGEVYLACAVYRIFKKIKVDTFCLNDVYRPVPKRTRFFVRSAIHFLIYMEANMQHCNSLMDNIIKKCDERSKLSEEKTELLQEISEKAEALAEKDHKREKLIQQKEALSIEHREMVKQKHLKDKLIADKELQIKKLRSECENEDYQLKCLEDEEVQLKEQVMTEEDFKDLKQMEAVLQNELERLSSEDVALDGALTIQKENLQSLESCANKLVAINFDGPSNKVDTLQCLEEKLMKQSAVNSDLADNIKQLQTMAEGLNREIHRLENTLKKEEHDFEVVKVETNRELDKMKAELDAQTHETKLKIKKGAQKLEIKQLLEDQIDQIKSDEEKLKETFMSEYKKVCDTQRHVINKTFAMFNNIKALAESEE